MLSEYGDKGTIYIHKPEEVAPYLSTVMGLEENIGNYDHVAKDKEAKEKHKWEPPEKPSELIDKCGMRGKDKRPLTFNHGMSGKRSKTDEVNHDIELALTESIASGRRISLQIGTLPPLGWENVSFVREPTESGVSGTADRFKIIAHTLAFTTHTLRRMGADVTPTLLIENPLSNMDADSGEGVTYTESAEFAKIFQSYLDNVYPELGIHLVVAEQNSEPKASTDDELSVLVHYDTKNPGVNSRDGTDGNVDLYLDPKRVPIPMSELGVYLNPF